ncbi:unnamed protein product [Amoebophrya sp. A25]|nr:unnamed protein product [Amoebophrya sp. A25]|eukprot:GSA25T00003725001.1
MTDAQKSSKTTLSGNANKINDTKDLRLCEREQLCGILAGFSAGKWKVAELMLMSEDAKFFVVLIGECLAANWAKMGSVMKLTLKTFDDLMRALAMYSVNEVDVDTLIRAASTNMKNRTLRGEDNVGKHSFARIFSNAHSELISWVFQFEDEQRDREMEAMNEKYRLERAEESRKAERRARQQQRRQKIKEKMDRLKRMAEVAQQRQRGEPVGAKAKDSETTIDKKAPSSSPVSTNKDDESIADGSLGSMSDVSSVASSDDDENEEDVDTVTGPASKKQKTTTTTMGGSSSSSSYGAAGAAPRGGLAEKFRGLQQDVDEDNYEEEFDGTSGMPPMSQI